MAGTLSDVGKGSAGRGMITAINVTPLVDVVLVLLIILMVSSTYIVAQTLKVQLPKARSSDGPASKPKTIVLKADGQLLFDDAPATEKAITDNLTVLMAADPKSTVVISADQNVAHGRVVRMIDLAKSAGVTQFAINVELTR